MMSLRYSWLELGLGGKKLLQISRELLEIGVSDRQNKFVVSFSSIMESIWDGRKAELEELCGLLEIIVF